MLKSKVNGSDRETIPPCLAFANTVSWHASKHPEETLFSFTDLVAWAQGAGLVSNQVARKLLRDAVNRPVAARRVLQRAIVLREAIYRIFAALIRNKSITEADLAELNETLTKLTRGARVVRRGSGFAWKWAVDEAELGLLLGPIALSAAELLISDECQRVGRCADDRGCGWLFLDTTRNRSRRWCDINDCGNRAKQRRHRQRILKRKEAVYFGRAKPAL